MKDTEAWDIASLFLKENRASKITPEKLTNLIKKIANEKPKTNYCLPETGFLRLKNIIGDRKVNPPIPAIIPISESGWWKGIQEGKYPAPLYFGSRSAFWAVEDILELVDKIKKEGRTRD